MASWVRRMLIAGALFAGLGSTTAMAEGRPGKGVILLDMSVAQEGIDTVKVMDALALRLPGWSVRMGAPSPSGEVPCPASPEDAFLLRFISTSRNRLVVELESCEDRSLLFRERISGDKEIAESSRRVAVLVPLALEVEEEAPTAAKAPPVSPPGLFDRSRPVVTLGLAPGLTLAPSAGKAVFLGALDLGVLLVNGVAIRFAVDASSPYRGITDKKNLDAEEEVEVGVTDVAFRLLCLYRFELGNRWVVSLGLGLRYTQDIVRDLAENKYEIEESSVWSRGAGVAAIGAGVMIRRWFALFLDILPAVSFGRRTYKARGSEAIDLGYGTVGLTLGARFYL